MRGMILRAALILCSALAVAGCGGGGGGSNAPASAGAPASSGTATNYSARRLASGEVGPGGRTLAGAGVTLTASLDATATLSIIERVYPDGPPTGIVGRVVDLQPDGTRFRGSGARLCLSYAAYAGDVSELAIYTGANLDEKLAVTADAGSRMLCTTLAHASPYAIRRVRDLTLPEVSLFTTMDKTKNPAIVTTSTEEDPTRGTLTVIDIEVPCDLACVESGLRRFKFAAAGDHRGDLLIDERQAAYPLWKDAGSLFWTRLYGDSGGLQGGIAYYLALQFIAYYGGGAGVGAGTLDPATNRVTRLFYLHSGSTSPDLVVDLSRDDATAPGVVKMEVRDDYGKSWLYTIDRTTAAITKKAEFGGGPPAVTAQVTDAAYTALDTEALQDLYMLLGLDDTPDETPGDAHDKYVRMSPNQELFAVNVMNVLRGYGWMNTRAIEAYYRDRLACLTDDCRTDNLK